MNVFSFLIEAARQWPTAPAVVSDSRALTYQELLDEALELKESLVAQGIRPGMGIGLMAENSAEFVIGLFAGLACRAVVMPIAPDLREQEFNRVLELVPMAAIVHDGSLQHHARHTPGSPHKEFLIALRPEEYHCKVACGVPDAAVIRFTSGTTGSSKGVVLSNKTVEERTRAAIEGLNLTAGDSVLWVLPMAYHFVVSILTYVRFGVTVLLPNDTEAREIARAASKWKPSLMYASPDILEGLLRERSAITLPRTTRIVSTSMGLSAALAESFHAAFQTQIAQLYGLIEVGLPLGNPLLSPFPPSSVGAPMPRYEAAILDDRGRVLPPNEIGRLAVRGPGMFDAYLAPYRTRDEVLVNGWFMTGDLATQSFDGSITVCGRERSVIHIAGHKVFPEEVEGVLNSYPGVRSSRVFGVSHLDGSERVVAEVTTSAPPIVEIPALLSYAAERLSQYKVPSRIVVVPAIPKTNTGKVIRAA